MSGFTINEQREMNKHATATFAMDHWNSFDSSADAIIKKLEIEKKVNADSYNTLTDLYKNDRDKWNLIADEAGMSYSELENQNNQNLISVIYKEDEILAFLEMKIIYAYKFLEINIRRLLKSVYLLNSPEGFHKWENIKDFLKSKNIPISEIKSYREIEELRLLNNCLKHSSELNNLKTKISEFSNEKQINYMSLKKFYDRIKKSPAIFLDSLASALYNEQYEFDDEKLKVIAHSFALRMNKETAERFKTFLIKSYDL